MLRILPAFLLPTAAFAHAGDHTPLGFLATLAHALGEPDHAMIAVAALGLPVWLWVAVRGRK